MNRMSFGLLLLIAVLAALALTILLTAPKIGAQQIGFSGELIKDD